MDYEQFFPKQEMKACEREHTVLGVVGVLTLIYMLVDCIYVCSANQKMKALKNENETLKSIILKSVERNLLRMMHQSTEDEHED